MPADELVDLLHELGLNSGTETLVQWQTVVDNEVDRQSDNIVLSGLRPDGLLHILLTAFSNNGFSLLNESGNGAIDRIKSSLRSSFDLVPAKFLTANTVANIRSNENFRSGDITDTPKYWLSWPMPPDEHNIIETPSSTLVPMVFVTRYLTGVDSSDADTPEDLLGFLVDHPEGLAVALGKWDRVPFNYQKLVFTDRSGNFTLTLNGRTTGPIDASLLFAGEVTDGVNNDLRTKVREELAALNVSFPADVPPCSVFYNGNSASPALEVYFFGTLDNVYPTGSFYSAETSMENTMTSSIDGGSITITQVVGNDQFHFLDFLGDGGVPLVDSTGKSIKSMKYDNHINFITTYLRTWLGEYDDLGGKLDDFILDFEGHISTFHISRDYYYGGADDAANVEATADKLRNENIFKTGFWKDKLPDDLHDSFVDIRTWWNDASTGGEPVTRSQCDGVCRLQRAAFADDIFQIVLETFPNAKNSNFFASPQTSQFPIGNLSKGNVHSLQGFSGTHSSPVNYNGRPWVNDIGDSALEEPPDKAANRSWSPAHMIRWRYIQRNSSGIVTMDFWTDAERASDPILGGDQTIDGLSVGDRVRLFANTTADRGIVGSFLANNVTDQFFGFPITEIGTHTVDYGDGAESRDFIKYQDTETSALGVVDGKISPNRFGNGTFLTTLKAWEGFLSDLLNVRSSASAYDIPIQSWWINWGQFPESEDRQFGRYKTQWRAESWFHSVLCGELDNQILFGRGWLNENDHFPSVAEAAFTYTFDDITDWAQFDTARQEINNLFGFVSSEIRPLSINFEPLSMQGQEYVISGVSLPDSSKLFRITLKDVGGSVGLLPLVSNDFRDFRTVSGLIVRVPGQIVSGSFEDNGWWVKISA